MKQTKEGTKEDKKALYIHILRYLSHNKPNLELGDSPFIPNFNPCLQAISIHSGHSNTGHHIKNDEDLKELACLRRRIIFHIEFLHQYES